MLREPKIPTAKQSHTSEERPGPLKLAAEERAELHLRLAAHRADPASSIPWEQVRETLFKDFVKEPKP